MFQSKTQHLRRFAVMLTASALLAILPLTAQAATFCTMEVTGVRLTSFGNLQLRAHEASEPESQAILLNMCNVTTKKGGVDVEVCKAWHVKLLSALHTDDKVIIQLQDEVMANENLGASCTELTHHAQYWNALTSVEAK